ncbi:RNA 3'-phosphate cyclase, partial [Candidatus Woesearchaeota archaeon]|nr:RNA 3'-phosphate cyclase [Candidatus Woesearchaeota archaeon]
RQAEQAKKILEKKFGQEIKIETKYAETLCAGSGIQLYVKTENSVLGSSGLGELGKKAELVGEEAAKQLIEEFCGGVVDSHAADQLLPYMALAGRGSFITSRITNHVKTNAFVIEKFLPVKFEIEHKKVSCNPL